MVEKDIYQKLVMLQRILKVIIFVKHIYNITALIFIFYKNNNYNKNFNKLQTTKITTLMNKLSTNM